MTIIHTMVVMDKEDVSLPHVLVNALVSNQPTQTTLSAHNFHIALEMNRFENICPFLPVATEFGRCAEPRAE
jgi:hypothetical protein